MRIIKESGTEPLGCLAMLFLDVLVIKLSSPGSSQDIANNSERLVIRWGFDNSAISLSSPLSKQEEPCFATKEISSLVICPLVNSPIIILSFLVTDAFEEHVLERSSHSPMDCTSLEISPCIQGPISENNVYLVIINKWEAKAVKSLSTLKVVARITFS